MKLMATVLVAVFVAMAGASVVFADCAGHSKAQLVQSETPQQMTSDRQVSNQASPATLEQVAKQANTVKEKK
jgi:apolipoprotein N-acyltransferase